jgi:hypothetical protein
VFLTLALAIFAFVGVVQAASTTGQAGAPLVQEQATPAGTPASDAPVGDAPAAQETAPLPVQTGDVPIGVATGEAITGNPVVPPGQEQNTGRTQAGGFPWLIAIILGAVAVLGVIALLMTRSRRAVTAQGPALTPPPAPRTPTSATTTTTARGPGATAYGAAPAAAGATAVAAAGAMPTSITCPNCGTANQVSENFCHECGQDLRAERQKLMAAAAPPPDVVTDDMPYLETLDRTDEQLEYVLSRNRVVLGTAAGSDVVIGDVFQGHETVSPRHAELRKEGEGFMVLDLDSEQGTFVNDVRTGENLLSDGDEIRLGSVRFVFRVPQA